MIQDLRIVHRRKPSVFTSPEFPVWSTCLRSLAFAPVSFKAEPQDEVYTQQAAYKFLLEIICGLKSPIVGETEVMGQFKIFCQTWVAADPRRATLVQRLLNDAKAIRNAHLSKLGTQSYGSWVRKNLNAQAKSVDFVGAGLLAREILPYVQKLVPETRVHARNIERIDFHENKAVFAASGFQGGALVIAAPVSARQILAFVGEKMPTQIFDLRETDTEDPIQLDTQIFALHEIFAEIEKTRLLLQPRLKEVHREIGERSAKAFEHTLLRPGGWDDLCA